MIDVQERRNKLAAIDAYGRAIFQDASPEVFSSICAMLDRLLQALENNDETSANRMFAGMPQSLKVVIVAAGLSHISAAELDAMENRLDDMGATSTKERTYE